MLGCHNQLQSSGVLNGQVNVGGADSGLRACGRRPDHPPDGQNCPQWVGDISRLKINDLEIVGLTGIEPGLGRFPAKGDLP